MYSEYRNCIEKKARITTVSDDESSTETPTARVDPKRSRASGSESGGKAKNPTKRRRSIDTTVIPREAIITNEPKITHEGKPWVPRKKPTLESPDSQIRLKQLGLEFSVSRDRQNTYEIQVTDRDHEVFGTRHQSLDATAEKPIPSVAAQHIFPEYDSENEIAGTSQVYTIGGLPNAIISDQPPAAVISKGGREWRFSKNSTMNLDIEDEKGPFGTLRSDIGGRNYTTTHDVRKRHSTEAFSGIKIMEEWEVKKIIGKRIQKGTEHYWVSWIDGSKTWEPIENRDNCRDLINIFLTDERRKAAKAAARTNTGQNSKIRQG